MSSDAVSVRLLQMCRNRHVFGAYTSPNEHLVSTGSSLYRMCMCLNAGQTQATTGEQESILTSFAAMACESSGDLGNPWLDRLPGVLAGVILRLPMSSHLSMILCFVCPIKCRDFHFHNFVSSSKALFRSSRALSLGYSCAKSVSVYI